MRESLNFEAERMTVHSRIEKEAEWRMSLSPGDYIDAMAKYKTPTSNNYHFIQGWARAKVLEADENTVTIGFLGRGRANNLMMLRQSD